MPSEKKVRKMINRHKAMHVKLKKDYHILKNSTSYEDEATKKYLELEQDWAFLKGDLNIIFEEHPEREIREAVGETIFFLKGEILENELRLGTELTQEELRKVFEYQTDCDNEEGLKAAELLGLTKRQYLLHIYRKSFKPFQREMAGKELEYSELRVWLHQFSMEGRYSGYLTAIKKETDKHPVMAALTGVSAAAATSGATYALYQWLSSG